MVSKVSTLFGEIKVCVGGKVTPPSDIIIYSTAYSINRYNNCMCTKVKVHGNMLAKGNNECLLHTCTETSLSHTGFLARKLEK